MKSYQDNLDSASEASATMAEGLKRGVEKAKETAQELVEEGLEKAKEARESLTGLVRDYPTASLLIAAGVSLGIGVLVGALIPKR